MQPVSRRNTISDVKASSSSHKHNNNRCDDHDNGDGDDHQNLIKLMLEPIRVISSVLNKKRHQQ
jgi:hypothetical protein